ncbi:unnamed protein product [Closterium sp. NIES-64]|nr:unnamed protein product [Closterium sp. NIES-64]
MPSQSRCPLHPQFHLCNLPPHTPLQVLPHRLQFPPLCQFCFHQFVPHAPVQIRPGETLWHSVPGGGEAGKEGKRKWVNHRIQFPPPRQFCFHQFVPHAPIQIGSGEAFGHSVSGGGGEEGGDTGRKRMGGGGSNLLSPSTLLRFAS